MKKKVIGIVAAIVVVLGLSLVVYNQIIPNEYVPADDEIALHLQFDTEEDIGLLVYDYRVDSHEYSGGISNADGSLIKRDADNIVVLNKEELNNVADTFELSMQFRIITEYVVPNYENVYPDDITKYMEPISWEAHFGESYFITITKALSTRNLPRTFKIEYQPPTGDATEQEILKEVFCFFFARMLDESKCN